MEVLEKSYYLVIKYLVRFTHFKCDISCFLCHATTSLEPPAAYLWLCPSYIASGDGPGNDHSFQLPEGAAVTRPAVWGRRLVRTTSANETHGIKRPS